MDLCRDVRDRSEVPVILVGADSSEVDRVVALELGADDYMAKPYSRRELAARLRAVLRRGRGNGRWACAVIRRPVSMDGWSISPGAKSWTLPARRWT
jgi:DNA-binding response OmpR family regulator